MKYSITISDTHLGATGFHRTQFNDFLSDILSNRIRAFDSIISIDNIKHLIILGDFFDLMMEIPAYLDNDFQEIYEQLKNIRNKGIEVTHVLGNHEISVSGDYNAKFTDRKNKLYGDLTRYQNLLGYLKEDDLCQYVLLILKNDNFMLSRCDDITEISSSSQPDTQNFLMCHGYQFLPRLILLTESKIWDEVLKITDRHIKKLIDKIWNDILKRRGEISFAEITHQTFTDSIIEDVINLHHIEESSFEEIPFIKYFDDTLSFLEYEDLDEETQEAINRSDFDNLRELISIYNMMEITFLSLLSIEGIKEKLIDDFLLKNQLNNITDVIFGHTHKADKFTTSNRIEVGNDGAWQLRKDQSPYYLIINTRGEFEYSSYC